MTNPVAQNVSGSGNEDTVITITLLGSDPIDGDLVTGFYLSSIIANGSLFLDSGLTQAALFGVGMDASATPGSLTLYFVPDDDWFGETAFAYFAADEFGEGSTPATGTLTVNSVNDAPTLSPGGTLDDSFGGDGVVTTNFSGSFPNLSADGVHAVAIQPDGKIVAAGLTWNFSPNQVGLARYNPDGSLDTSFGGGDGRVVEDETYGFMSNGADALAIQADGKIVVAGPSGGADFAVFRYNADGSRDFEFGNGSIGSPGISFENEAHAVLVRTDGDIIVAGTAMVEGIANVRLTRLNSDGTSDWPESVFTNFEDGVRGFGAALQADGKIVVVGSALLLGFLDQDFAVLRYNADGTLDSTFGGGDGIVTTDFEGFNDTAYGVAIQGDGKIVVAGSAQTASDGDLFAVARYDTDGDLDSTFSGDGLQTAMFGNFGNDQARSVAIQGDGKIVVGGFADPGAAYNFALARFESDGDLDPMFGSGGLFNIDVLSSNETDTAHALVIQRDGSILLAGEARVDGGFTSDFALVRVLGGAGIGDQRVDESTPFALTVPASLFSDVDGDTLAYSATLENGDPLPDWLVFTPGTRSFAGTPENSDGGTYQIKITASDGEEPASDIFSLVVSVAPVASTPIEDQEATEDSPFNFTFPAGTFTDANAGDVLTYAATLAGGADLPTWLEFDGATRTFSGTPLNEDVGSIQVEVTASDGSLSASDTFEVAVLNTDDAPILTPAGTLDTTLGGDGTVVADVGEAFTQAADIFLLADGRIVVGGRHGDGAFVARFDDEGNPDTTFSGDGYATLSATVIPAGSDVALQGDGKIVVAGGNGDIALVRLSADGSLDTTFGGDGSVSTDLLPLLEVLFGEIEGFETFESADSVVVQADGKIVVLGTVEANMVPGSVGFLARYDSDGSLDGNFGAGGVLLLTDPFFTTFSTSGDLLVQPDGKIVAVGGVHDGFQPRWWVSVTDGGSTFRNEFFDSDFQGTAVSVAVQDDGKIVVLGTTEFGGATLARLNANLQLDETFSDDGIVTLDIGVNPRDVFVDDAGRIVVSGASGGSSLLARFNADGTLDGSFGDEGVVVFQPEGVLSSASAAMAVDAIGRIVMTGTADEDVMLARVMGDLLGDQVVNTGTPFSLALPANTFTDPDGDAITGYTATLADDSPLPDWLTFDTVTRTFSGTPDTGDAATYDIKVNASEGDLTGSHVFELKVNGAPTVFAAIPDQQATEDAPFSFTFAADTFADPNLGEELRYVAIREDGSSLPFWLSFDAIARTFTGTPGNFDVGTVHVKVTASDGSLSASDVFDLTVNNTNDAPFVAFALAAQAGDDGIFAAGIGQSFLFQFDAATFFDEDVGDTLDYTATLENGDPLPLWLGFNGPTRTFSGTPGEGDSGEIQVKVTATDDGSATATDTFSLAVTHAPELVTPFDDQVATEDSSFLFTFAPGTFADDDGETLTYYATIADSIEGTPGGNNLPAWLQFDGNTRTFSGTPDNVDVGPLDITVWATDGFLFATDTFTIDVANTNDAPVLVAGGQLDETLGGDGDILRDIGAGNDAALTLVVQPNGRIVIAGLSSDGVESQVLVARYRTSGIADATFGADGVQLIDIEGGLERATDIALQADGKFLVSVQGTGDFDLLRLNADGSLDTSFADDGRATAVFGDPAAASDVALLAGGKILVAGDANGLAALARFNADGTLDTSFSGDGKALVSLGSATAAIRGMAVQADGKIVLAGSDGAAVLVARLNADGTLDTGFGGGDGWLTRQISLQPDTAHDVAVQVDGKIVVVGTASDFSDPFNLEGFALRLLADGALDTSFGQGAGVVQSAPNYELTGAFAVALTDAGSIVIAGAGVPGLESVGVVTRLNPDGTLDAGFGDNGQQEFGSEQLNIAFGVAILPNGNIVAAGAGGDFSFPPDDPLLPMANGQVLVARLLAGAPQSVTAVEDSLLEFEFPATAFLDVDTLVTAEEVLTYSVTAAGGGALPAWLAFNPETQTFSGTPENADVGSTPIEITVTDLAGASVSHLFTITVQNVNDAPLVAHALPDKNVNEGNAFIMNLPLTTFADVDVGDTFTFDVALAGDDPLPDWLLYLPASRTLLGTPSQADVGTYEIAVTANDGEATTVDSFTVVVTNVNVSPFLAHPIELQNATEDDAFSFQFAGNAFSDPDGDGLTYTAALAGGGELPEWLTLDSATRTFSGTPSDADVGTLEVRLTASDGSLSASDLFTIEVANINDEPVLASPIDDQAAVAGNPFVFTIASEAFTDDDGDTLTFTATLADDSSLPAWLAFDGLSRTFSGTPALTDTGVIEVKVTAADSSQDVTDTFQIAVNTNLISGTPGNDQLFGTPVNDAIDGGAGGDIMSGGAGNDTYYVDSVGDVVIELPAGGTDSVVSIISYELGSDLENLTLGGTGAISGVGNDGANVLTGNAASNVLVGGLGNDTYIVTGGVDQFVERAGGGVDTVYSGVSWVLGAALENLVLTGSASINGTGNTATNTITGNSGNNSLSGGDGNDTLLGAAGDDTLSGGAGNDSMAGAAGNDLYFYGTGDTIAENAGEGLDTVMTGISLSFAVAGREHFEDLTLTGSGAINGTGNALDNLLTGNAGRNALTGGAGNDTLTGGAGIDTLRGGAGNDTYMYGTGDIISELADEGTDLVLSGVSLTLAANVDNLSLTGLAAVNGTGNALANVIEGNVAANSLSGAAGNDILTGGGGNDMLNGGADNDVLNGNSGNDVLNGSTGADAMAGGDGNDTYVVDNAGDSVNENASAGTDLVQSAITWTLGANTENLTLIGSLIINGTGNELANMLVGNGAINILSGDLGNDTLNGGAGADTMMGGAGDDTYVYGAGDLIVELLDQGIDLVQSAITVNLTAHVENLQLMGSAAISGTGNELANLLTGNAGANTLNGGAGDDSLNGGAGNDVLIGGAGNDTYVFGTGDRITELDGGGTDLVQSAVSHALAANVDNLTLTGAAAINGTGNALSNILNGNTGANTLSGMGGDDVLDGGAGADSLLGGDGNDVLVHGVGDRRVDGGAGEDTLRFMGSEQALDLTAIANTVHTGIEIMDLTGTGNNTLTLNLADVLALSGTTDTLRIDGDGGDTVNSAGWTQGATAAGYTTYTQGTASLLIDTDITNVNVL